MKYVKRISKGYRSSKKQKAQERVAMKLKREEMKEAKAEESDSKKAEKASSKTKTKN